MTARWLSTDRTCSPIRRTGLMSQLMRIDDSTVSCLSPQVLQKSVVRQHAP
jgi:hypothetical protein